MPSYEALKAKFEGLNVQVLGISVDHIPCLTAWAESLGGISYPLLSDFWPHGAVSAKYGILRSEGHSERAIFIVDPQGVIRYIDVHAIDDQPDNDVLFAELMRIVPNAEKLLQSTIPAELPHGGVVMYCTAWCPDCHKARAWLKNHHIAYQEVDITTTPGASEQVRKWANGNQVTPTFDIDGTIIVDYDPQKLAEVLKVTD